MSQEDEQLVRRHFDFWNERHDPEALAEAFWHEEVEWIEPPDSLDAAVFRGRRAAAGFLRQWVKHMGETPAIVEDVLHAGEELVATVRLRLRGAGSGAAVETPIYYVLRIRDGRIQRIRPFYARKQALEAAGLRDE